MDTHSHRSSCIGIVGLGLIGGSLGIDLQNLGHKVYGLVNRSQTKVRAKERNLAQVVSTDPTILHKCDVVILALPIETLIEPPKSLIEAIPKNAVVTDVGSVKSPIKRVWEKLHNRFIPSHPMAGTNEAGVDAGRQKLFKSRPWVITSDSNSDQKALKVINELAISLGSEVIQANAEMHDQAVALISHLPVLISANLLLTVENESNPLVKDLSKVLASSGFEDTTRVGGGNPSLGTAMMSNNTSAMIQALSSYRYLLERFEKQIISGDWLGIHQDLEKAQSIRTKFIKNK